MSVPFARGAADEVIIMDRGGGRARRVPVVQVSARREVRNSGELSCFARISDLRPLGLAGEIRGMWLEWHHPTWGTWGGVISGRPIHGGIAEITVDGWAVLLRGRPQVEPDRPPAGSAGGLARRIVTAAGAEEPTFVTIGSVDEGGEPLSISVNAGDTLDDLLPSVDDAIAMEWIVDENRAFHIARRLGRDLSNRVRLVEGRHFSSDDSRIDDDLWSSASGQRLVLESAEMVARREAQRLSGSVPIGKHVSTPRVVSIEEPAEGQLVSGLGTGTLRFLKDAPPRVYAPVGVNQWSEYREVTSPASFVTSDVDRIWARFSLADTITVDIGSAHVTARFRVMVDAIDVANRSRTISGQLTPIW
jgi:hypothetical protein